MGEAGNPAPACPTPATGFPLVERQPGVNGCPADIRTRPGDYQGYQTAFGCLDRGDTDRVVVIRGSGKKTFRQLLGSAPGEDEDWEKNAWNRFAENVRQAAGVKSTDRGRRVHACRSAGYAIEVRMHDFREVDDAVRGLGDWLTRMNLGGEVMLVLAPRPEPGEQ